MYLKLILFLGLIINVVNGYSQSIVIVDSITKEPIPYVIVKYNHEGFYTDINGRILIDNNIDSIYISHLQYASKHIAFEHTDTIWLKPKIELLEEIIITRKNKKTEIIKPTKIAKNLPSFPITENLELLMKVSPNAKLIDKVLEELSFEFRTTSGNGLTDSLKAAFRVNLYDIKNNIPKSVLFSSNPLLIKPKKKGVFSVDLRNSYIEIPEEGLFVGLEFIGYYENNEIAEISPHQLFSLVLTDRENPYFSGETFIDIH